VNQLPPHSQLQEAGTNICCRCHPAPAPLTAPNRACQSKSTVALCHRHLARQGASCQLQRRVCTHHCLVMLIEPSGGYWYDAVARGLLSILCHHLRWRMQAPTSRRQLATTVAPLLRCEPHPEQPCIWRFVLTDSKGQIVVQPCATGRCFGMLQRPILTSTEGGKEFRDS
jgi:hypothetical protein